MIRVHCRTNLDDFKHEIWPHYFACRPMKGDYVQSVTGARLQIVSITHSKGRGESTLPGDREYYPILIIELHN